MIFLIFSLAIFISGLKKLFECGNTLGKYTETQNYCKLQKSHSLKIRMTIFIQTFTIFVTISDHNKIQAEFFEITCEITSQKCIKQSKKENFFFEKEKIDNIIKFIDSKW